MTDLRPHRRQLLKRAGVFGVLAVLLNPVSALAKSTDDVERPEGSWLSTVTVLGSGAPPPFLVLETFTAGGGYVEIDQADFAPPVFGSPGHGAWESTGERTFAATFLVLKYDAKGNAQGMTKVRGGGTISEDGGAYSGAGNFEIFDVNGNLIYSANFTIQAKRIRVERL